MLTFMRFHPVVLTIALLVSCVADAAPDRLATAVTRQMQVNQERYGIAGQAVLVAHNGKVLFRGVSGRADLATGRPVRAGDVFPVYSLAKLFVSTLVMQLVEQGAVDLDQPASIYVRDLAPAWQAITVRQLLNHMSGLPEYFGDLKTLTSFPSTKQAALEALAGKPLDFAPGTATRYNQTNYVVLAMLLEAHYGKPYPQIARERIVQRLGLEHTWLGVDAVPKKLKVTAYTSNGGRLEPSKVVPWPAYSFGHAELFSTIDDLAKFMQAMRTGTLVGRRSLDALWRPQTLSNGQRGVFSTGWEYGASGAHRHVGHDGGAHVRVRMAFKETVDGDNYVFIYLTNGSVNNVWSRTLVNSVAGVVAPQAFPAEALSRQLTDYALKTTSDGAASAQAQSILTSSGLQGEALERAINGTGYAVRDNLGVAAAIRVFELNTLLFPKSANAWDSLAEAYQAQGDRDKAKASFDKARMLAAPQPAPGT
jgi:D-alanyl-D-alanine carboxypeptidase